VEDGVSGFIENPFDVEAYAERIASLLRDEGLRARMGEAGRAALVERFSMGRLADDFLGEYAAGPAPR
jgi:glycosyltransferase involved in cell wall biosynthesis